MLYFPCLWIRTKFKCYSVATYFSFFWMIICQTYIYITFTWQFSIKCKHLFQCVANIWIFQYIQIFIDKYNHLPKYLWVFPEWIYLDIHSRLFSPHEYIWIFIRNVGFQRIHSNKADQHNISGYLKQKIGNLTFQRLILK